METDKLLDLLKYQVPPTRPPGIGVTAIEFAEVQGCVPNTARRLLMKTDLVGVTMLVDTKHTKVFLPAEDVEANEHYKAWI